MSLRPPTDRTVQIVVRHPTFRFVSRPVLMLPRSRMVSMLPFAHQTLVSESVWLPESAYVSFFPAFLVQPEALIVRINSTTTLRVRTHNAEIVTACGGKVSLERAALDIEFSTLGLEPLFTTS